MMLSNERGITLKSLPLALVDFPPHHLKMTITKRLQIQTINTQLWGTKNHLESWTIHTYIVFLCQREALFIPQSVLCSLEACFWVLHQDDVFQMRYTADDGDGICLIVVCVFQVFINVLSYHLSETVYMEIWTGACVLFFE